MKIFSQVLKKAHALKATYGTWSAALSAAWSFIKIKSGRVTAISYRKSDGTVRQATVGVAPEGAVKGTGTAPAIATLVRYWDAEANGFRSFHIQSLVSFS